TDRMTKMPFIYKEHTAYVATIPDAYLEGDSGIIYRHVQVSSFRFRHFEVSTFLKYQHRRCHVYTSGQGPNTKFASFTGSRDGVAPSMHFNKLASVVQMVHTISCSKLLL